MVRFLSHPRYGLERIYAPTILVQEGRNKFSYDVIVGPIRSRRLSSVAGSIMETGTSSRSGKAAGEREGNCDHETDDHHAGLR